MTESALPNDPTQPRHAAAEQRDSAPQLILASGSPRRSALLREAGYAFTICPSNVDESDHPARLSAEELARFLAEQKARAVAAAFPDAVVLGADTVVAVRPGSPQAVSPRPSPDPAAEPLGSGAKFAAELILGKPTDIADARRILNLLSGTTHSVITAVAILRGSPPYAEITAIRSTVRMRPLTNAELDAYLATNDWQGKAGAYGIQDNDPFVTATAGCHTNIVGLPMTTTSELLAKAGILPVA